MMSFLLSFFGIGVGMYTGSGDGWCTILAFFTRWTSDFTMFRGLSRVSILDVEGAGFTSGSGVDLLEVAGEAWVLVSGVSGCSGSSSSSVIAKSSSTWLQIVGMSGNFVEAELTVNAPDVEGMILLSAGVQFCFGVSDSTACGVDLGVVSSSLESVRNEFSRFAGIFLNLEFFAGSLLEAGGY